MFQSETGKTKIFLLILVLIGFGALAYLRFESLQSFPAVASGHYLGTISGFESSEPHTLYWEMPEASNTLLAIIFRDRFQPQAIKLEQGKPQTSFLPFRGKTGLAPVVIEDSSVHYSLSGQVESGTIGGRVQGSDGSYGRWVVKPVTEENLDRDTAEMKRISFPLTDWLSYKAQVLEVQRNLKKVKETLKEKQQYAGKLDKFVTEGALLRDRASTRRDVLKGELEQVISKHKETNNQVQALVDELDLLTRISKQGQSIVLARRVSNRETKWYLAHWGVAEDQAGLEEFFGQGVQVNLRELDLAVKRSLEIRSLLNEIQTERQRIRELEGSLSEEGDSPVRPIVPYEPENRREGPPEDKRSLWEKIFD